MPSRPGDGCSQISAYRARFDSLGPIVSILAPFWRAFRVSTPTIEKLNRVSRPIARMVDALLIPCMEIGLLKSSDQNSNPPPRDSLPVVSIELVPITMRVNFWATYRSSLVQSGEISIAKSPGSHSLSFSAAIVIASSQSFSFQ